MTSYALLPVAAAAGSIPQLGFGTWQSKPGEVGEAVEVAVKAGFRHIDCARIYRNEGEIGAALARLFASGDAKRQELFVVSKLWNTDHHPANVETACRRSLADLGLEYLDLYLIHWPVAWRHGGSYANAGDFFPRNSHGGSDIEEGVTLLDTWRALERLVDLGLTKHIGLSNCSIDQVREVVGAARHKPLCNQVEVQPGLPQEALAAAHRELGVATVAYCPLAVGMGPSGELSFLNSPGLQALSKTTGIPAAELLLRWNLQRGNVVLTKSVKPERIAEAAALRSDAVLTPEVVAEIDALGRTFNVRVCNPDFFLGKPGPFFASQL